MADFSMQDFANDVYYSMKERGYRDLTDEQLEVVQAQNDAGTWDNDQFTKALVNANNLWADDVVAGEVEVKGSERDLQRYVAQAEATGNQPLAMAVRELCRAVIRNDIQTQTVHVPTIHTNARFHLQDTISRALGKAFAGNTSELMELSQRTGEPNDVNYAMQAMAAAGMMQAHHAMNPQEPKTGTSAAMDMAARPS